MTESLVLWVHSTNNISQANILVRSLSGAFLQRKKMALFRIGREPDI